MEGAENIMSGEHNGKAELLNELNTLRQRVRELEQANQALTDFEKQFKGLFENTPVGVYRTTPDGRIIMVNPAIIQMLGYSSFQELLQLNVEKVGFAPGYPRSAFKELIERDGKVVGLESAWIRRDGTLLFLIENARAVRDESEKTLYYEGIVQDITERKRLEEDIKESEQRFRSIFDNAADGLLLADIETKKFYMANRTICQMLGYTDEEIKSLTVNDIHPLEDLPCVIDQFEKQSRGEIKLAKNTPVRRKDGSVFYADINTFVITLETRPYLTGIFRDVTERRKNELALKQQEETLQAILNATTESVFLIDSNGTILALNSTAAKRLGKDVSDFVGQKHQNIYDPPISPSLVRFRTEKIHQVFKTGKPVDFEDERAGLIFHTIIYPVFDSAGKVENVAIFAQDITEQKKTEAELRKTRERLEYILATTPVTTYTCKVSGDWSATFISENVRNQFGYEPRQFVEDTNFWSEHIHPDDKQRVFAELSCLLENDFYIHEYRFLHKNGDYRWVHDELRLIRDQKGNPLECIGYMTDVTERKRIEDSLRESELRYRTLAESAQDHIFIIDKQRNIKYVNPYGVMNLGKHPEQVIGKPLGVLFPPEVSETPLQNVERVFETGKPLFGFKDRIKLPDRELWIDTNIIPLKNAQGQVEAVMGISRDITELKMMEEILRESEEKYRQLVSTTTDAIMVFDAQTRQFIEVNKACEELYGYSREEFLNLKHSDITDEPEKSNESIEKTLAGKLSRIPLRYHRKKDGTVFPVEISAGTFELRGRRILCGVVRDITERKEIEQALKESELRYRTLFDTSPVGVGLASIDGKVLAFNNTLLNMTGYSEAEIRQINLKDTYVNPQERTNLMEKLRANGIVQNFEAQLKRKDGTTYWASITTNMFNQAGQDVLLTVVVDITERKIAEEKIRTLSSAVEQSIDGISIADLEPRLLYVNKAYAQMHGFAPEEMIGMPVANLQNKKQIDTFKADMNQLKSRGFGEGEREHIKKDGAPFSVYISTTVLRDNDGRPIGILAVSRDITESKQQEKELNSYRQKIARAEQWASVGTLGASLAHELTQPLTVITLSAENALTEMESTSHPAPGMNQLRDVLSEISTVNSIVRRFRDAARKSSERNIRQVVLKEIAERTLKLFDESARRANVILTLTDFDRLPAILSSEEELGQIFYVLIENAIQAADGKQQRHLVISGEVKDENVVLRFSDNCSGIVPEDLNRIFEPFFSTKQAGEATGLGLCIVEHIISRAGGKIYVESKLGEGTTFYITLPIESYI